MTWLYTILFSGLVFSSQPATSPSLASYPHDTILVSNIRADETQHFEQTYPLNANGRVSVSNVNGSISLDAWDRNEVKLEYTKTADSKERLNDVVVQIDSRADAINILTDYDNWKRGNNSADRNWKFSGKLEVSFKLTVPRGAMLNEIETVNGSVDL